MRDRPRAPGLTGAWRGGPWRAWRGLWRDPGGFGVLGADDDHPLNQPSTMEVGRSTADASSRTG